MNGPRRPVAKTKPLFGNCRRSSRSALISSPRSGWTLGLPLLTRRTCKEAKFHLRPFHGSPKPVPERDQDQNGVPVPVAAVLGRLHEPLNFGHGKIFPRLQLVVWWADWN